MKKGGKSTNIISLGSILLVNIVTMLTPKEVCRYKQMRKHLGNPERQHHRNN